MNKIYIIHENDEWIEPLRIHLNDLQISYEEWHMDKININTLNDPPFGIFYNRMSASSHTRGHRYAPEYTSIVLNWLESHNRRVINNSQALSLEISKSLQYKELEKVGLKVPGTNIPIVGLSDFDQYDVLINLAWHINGEIKKYLEESSFDGDLFAILPKFEKIN